MLLGMLGNSSEVQHALVTGRSRQPSHSKIASSATGPAPECLSLPLDASPSNRTLPRKRTKINVANVAEATGLEPCSCHVSHSEPLVSAQIQAFLNSAQFLSSLHILQKSHQQSEPLLSGGAEPEVAVWSSFHVHDESRGCS